MKSLFNFLGIALLACTVLLSTSCKDDDGPTIDPGTGLNLADGFYLAASGVDPVSSAGLSSEQVEDDGFATQDRSGFVANYIYLTAGDYNLVNVTAKEVTSTIGLDSIMVISDEGSNCDFNDYTRIKTKTDGEAINVATEGLYKVSYDPTTSEMIMYQIVQPGIIGNATPNGWGADTPMTGSVTAAGGSFSVSDVILREGEMKLRFNCRWTINRRFNDADLFVFDNGYQMFTNFGGTASDLQPGAGNIQVALADEGIYTVTANWDPSDGWSLDLNKTGDAPMITFDPDDFRWAAIGDATAGGWDSDQNMYYKGEVDGVHTWYGVVTFADMGQFKFRANDAWDKELSGALTADGTDVTMTTTGGGNIDTPGAGAYFITIKTADEGATWTTSMTNAGWGIIGAATPTGWDSDTDMTADGFVDGVTTYSITIDLGADQFKFRANDGWDYNLGGDLMGLTADGDNLSVASAGTYTVTLSFDGETYTASVN